MSWKRKRTLIPGGVQNLMAEIGLTPQQINLVADPHASIREILRESGVPPGKKWR